MVPYQLQSQVQIPSYALHNGPSPSAAIHLTFTQPKVSCSPDKASMLHVMALSPTLPFPTSVWQTLPQVSPSYPTVIFGKLLLLPTAQEVYFSRCSYLFVHQWRSNLSVHQHHPGGLLELHIPRPHSQGLWSNRYEVEPENEHF